jgi:hypothetical protein
MSMDEDRFNLLLRKSIMLAFDHGGISMSLLRGTLGLSQGKAVQVLDYLQTRDIIRLPDGSKPHPPKMFRVVNPDGSQSNWMYFSEKAWDIVDTGLEDEAQAQARSNSDEWRGVAWYPLGDKLRRRKLLASSDQDKAEPKNVIQFPGTEKFLVPPEQAIPPGSSSGSVFPSQDMDLPGQAVPSPDASLPASPLSSEIDESYVDVLKERCRFQQESKILRLLKECPDLKMYLLGLVQNITKRCRENPRLTLIGYDRSIAIRFVPMSTRDHLRASRSKARTVKKLNALERARQAWVDTTQEFSLGWKYDYAIHVGMLLAAGYRMSADRSLKAANEIMTIIYGS